MNDVVRRSLQGKVSNTTRKGVSQAADILSTARDIFVEDGYSKLSMRGVATQVGINLSTLQHYYKTKDDLVEAMLLHVLDELQTTINGIVSSLPSTEPVQQFKAVLSFIIDYANTDSAQKLFFELGALATRHKSAAETMDKVFTNARKLAQNLIVAINPHLDERGLAIRSALVVELLMGTMFIAGENRPRGRYLGKIDEDTLQAMVDIAVK